MSTGLKPHALGADLAVVDSVALAALSTNGLTISTKCFNFDVGAYFTLTVSTATPVTDQIIAANGLSNGRWILDPSSSTIHTAAPLSGDGSVGTDTSEDHGETFEDFCPEAYCGCCGWGGRLPVLPKKMLPWERKALEAGWAPPVGWNPSDRPATETKGS